ncbi:methionine ABC transporter ATP-binding protein [Anaerotignum sp. MB30-C6]|uniref:methionine ABC transporter ATP-binding protein n=1 Tax=Anaerotignum sp. MB30-C6 TaxID=3070814 RepID=UPI0027DE97E4|nr:methionine ABC transporter ATP-binding protein [Anaerotignum sp. MB30-C6]WMI80516.1 methionine ABC transporter ATP-binding protein [Anaerotignum sp. MB30-C6]
MIQLEKISKTFRAGNTQVHAVKEVSLDIGLGEVFGIIGFSGAGKSTLVRCINLLERPTEGKVILDGVDLMGLPQVRLREERRKMGMIFQHFNLLRSRTVYQNIAFPLRKSKLSKTEKHEKILSLLELVGLSDKKDAYPSQLSGGQKQRVAIARALANDPKVLLCDEATSALDPQTTKSILNLLKKVNNELGITIVLITHEMAVVKDICDRVAIMEDGRVVEEGETADVFSHPKEKLTRDFMDTASNINKIYELLEENHELTRVKEGEKLVLLTYSGGNAGESVISYLAEAYGVQANIIFGNVDILKNKPIGKLVVVLSGEGANMEKALQYIKQRKVQLEVIKG